MPRARPLIRFLLKTLFVLAVSLPVAILLLSIQANPIVQMTDKLDEEDINLIEQLIVDSNPGQFTGSGDGRIDISEQELNLLASYSIQNFPNISSVAVNLSLEHNTATMIMSLPLNILSFNLYLNITTEFQQQADRASLSSIQIGHIKLPNYMLSSILDFTQNQLQSTYENYQEFAELLQSIKSVQFDENELRMHLQWEPILISKIKSRAQQLFITSEDRIRILRYHSQINEIAMQAASEHNRVSLNTFIFPLFETAKNQSALGSDPIAENRALLQALALYVNNKDINEIVGDTEIPLPTAPRVMVTVHRRFDLAQHFVTSAAITASAGAGIAGIMSTSKEAYDARYRTGFSFIDLTASVAGVSFAAAATENTLKALQVQSSMSRASEETDYMPAVANEWDGLKEEEFNQQYRNRNSAQYRQRVAEIERQVAALPIYKGI